MLHWMTNSVLLIRGVSLIQRSLKALCHAIRADNEPTHAHAANVNWAWRMANKFTSHIQVRPLRLSLQHVRRFKHCMCSIASILALWPPIAEIRELLKSIINKIFALHAFDLHILSCALYRNTGCAHTSCTHFN